MDINEKYIFIISLFFIGQNLVGQGKNKSKIPSVLDQTNKFDGFFDFNYDEKNDIIYLTVNQLNKEFLYINSLSSGVGNNDIGLDRGQLGNERIVYFSKSGNKLLLIQPNLRYRSSSDNSLEQRSIEEAFAKSVLFGFPILENNNNGYIIDLTPFLLQDTHGVKKRLSDLGEGDFELDSLRSAINLSRTKAFPEQCRV